MSDRQLVAQDIADDIAQVEAALDAAIAATSGLVSRLPAYRMEASLSAVTGQEVFAALSQATLLLASARGEVVASHHRLEALRRAMKLKPTTAVGPIDKPSPSAPADVSTPGYEVA